MKKALTHKIIGLIATTIVIVSCNKDDEAYTPKSYIQPGEINMTISNETATSFDINFEAEAPGSIFYTVQRTTDEPPTESSIIKQNTANKVTAKRIEVKNDTTFVEAYNNNNTTYRNNYVVYALLTSVDGIPSKMVKQEVETSPCQSLEETKDMFLGDYTLSIVAGPDGPPLFEDGLVVTLQKGEGGDLDRIFEADYRPEVAAGVPTVPIQFSMKDNLVTITDGVKTGLSCDGESEILIGGNSKNAIERPCFNDYILLNMVDFQGGSGNCGASDVPFTIKLTKV